VARAFQIPQLFTEHTALENLLISVAAREGLMNPLRNLHEVKERAEMMHLLDMMGCADVADRPVIELSEGQRKLIDIAVALALKPRLLLMDEPTSGVASSEKFAVMETLVKALGEAQVTSVFVEHDMGIVSRYADEVAVWAAGNVQMRGSPAEILAHPDVIRDVIGEAV
jgi:branched-chain amino acid transport system ATP-binding protein